MNKKLVAVAVAGVLAAPLAAQAQTANVTLYGRLNLDYEIVNGTTCASASGNGSPCAPGTTNNPTVSRLSANSSRVGLRGVESLGGGLNAIFQIESDVRGDTNNANGWSSRETFVGLQGSWGTFKMGNFLMPYDDIHPIFGNVPTYTSSILSTASLWGQGPYTKQDGGFDARLGNSLRYDSPVWSGFNFSTQVSLRDSSGTAGGGNFGDHAQEVRHAYVWGIGGFYNNGPVQIGVAYENNQKVRSYATAGGGTLFADDWALTVAAGYNFGVVRPAIVYQRLDYDTPTGSLTQNMWGVSVTAPIGPGALYAAWLGASTGGGAAAGERVGAVTQGNDTNSQQYEVSYTYPLSKRTQVYVGYVKINNDKNAAYTFNINAYAINTACINSDSAVNQNTCGNNGKPGGFVMGMIHLF
jgi:predicted porin